MYNYGKILKGHHQVVVGRGTKGGSSPRPNPSGSRPTAGGGSCGGSQGGRPGEPHPQGWRMPRAGPTMPRSVWPRWAHPVAAHKEGRRGKVGVQLQLLLLGRIGQGETFPLSKSPYPLGLLYKPHPLLFGDTQDTQLQQQLTLALKV